MTYFHRRPRIQLARLNIVPLKEISMNGPACRTGVVYPALADPADLPGFAIRVEELGFDTLWVIEDCFLSGGLTMAATALAVTKSIGVGVGLLPVPLRNPAIMAMEIATLTRMHPGRFAATLGHGVAEWMQQIGAAGESS